VFCSASQRRINIFDVLYPSPFSLFRLIFAGPDCEESSMGCGLEDGTSKLLGTGVASALDGGSLSAVLKDGGFKPAMLCCLAPDFCVEPPVFLGAVRGVAISLPSIPRAMLFRAV
jgi:hypothetical protein